ncbi:hypothetical protein KY284_010590 [Solanum tuberosum]|nr:hypothetical protein KY284_010590 [Solanum tuberosum]
MPSCKALFLPEGISDHYPAKVVLNEEYKTRKAFQFCNVWKKHSKFLPIVQEGWKEHIENGMMHQVVRKLKLLKNKLRVLHAEEFQNIVREANADRGKLKHAQMQLQRDPYSIDCQQTESQLYHKLRTSSYLVEVLLQQRAMKAKDQGKDIIGQNGAKKMKKTADRKG